ncbi:MAG: CAP domain-containing protein [Microgenomates group bacterium]
MKKFFDFLYHLLIPYEGNNFRSKALHHDFLTYYLIFALFLVFAFKTGPLSNILGYATDITVEKLYKLTNQEREKNGLPKLSLNEKLSQAAYKKAQDMFAKNYWAHYSPDGTTPWEFILSSGYRYEYAGENLAKNFLFSDDVVSAWMNSPTHRENILRKEYSDIGLAVVNGILNGEETTLVVQMFGKPMISAIAKEVNAQSLPKEEKLPLVEAKKPVVNPQAVLAQGVSEKKINLIGFAFNINMIFLFFLFIALMMDFYFANKLGVIRMTGKNLGHFIFITFLLLSLLIIKQGAIL